MATWRKKNRVDEDTKVFIIRGGYGDVKRALKQRGWVENKDKESPCFDLKWTLKTKDIDTNTLLDNQIVNHFAKATSITTKVGLTHSLKNLIWFNNIDVDTFYPRCFDLGLQEEADDFISDFKATKAQCYLKIYAREIREAFESGSALVSSTVNKILLGVAVEVCTRRVRDLDDLIDDPTAFG
jgi:tubulin monoglycylase TTLL3/8